MSKPAALSDRPFLMTPGVLARILKAFAMRFGLDDEMADVVAQVHVQTQGSWQRWNEFLLQNCTQCRKDPDSCAFFNPGRAQVVGDATPVDLRNANMLLVETGGYTTCPVFESEENRA